MFVSFFFFPDIQNASSSSVCPLSFVVVIQGLFTSLLALINSLVMLVIVPQLQHGSGVHRVLVYLDPSFSLLAATVLIATTAPQVVTYSSLLHLPVSLFIVRHHKANRALGTIT